MSTGTATKYSHAVQYSSLSAGKCALGCAQEIHILGQKCSFMLKIIFKKFLRF